MADAPATHYEVLRVPTDATTAAIRVAYRDLAKRTHPDHGGDADAFRALRTAYETLVDEAARWRYDDELGVLRPAAGSSPAPATPQPDGWTGSQGEFTGDVDFPGYLSDVVASAWRPPDEPRAPEPEPVGPAQVGWWWSGSATRRPVAVGPFVIAVSGARVAGIDAQGGRELWALDLDAEVVAGPTPSGTLVILALSDGVVVAVDPARGAIAWVSPAVTPGRTRLGVDRASGTIAVAGGRSLLRIDPADGTAGRVLGLGAVASTLVVAGDVAFATTEAGIEGHDLERRRRGWMIRAHIEPDVPPEPSGQGVWLAPPGGRLVLLDPTSGGVRADVSVGASVAGLAGLDDGVIVSAAGPARIARLEGHGSVVWSCRTAAVGHAPVVSGGAVHVVGVDAVLRTIDLATGTELGESMLSHVPAGPPSAAAGQVLVVDRSGTVWSLLVGAS
jgi:outer membrane protein assembly factor BamB